MLAVDVSSNEPLLHHHGCRRYCWTKTPIGCTQHLRTSGLILLSILVSTRDLPVLDSEVADNFNHIADGDDFESYHESGNAIVQAYSRFFEEEKTKVKEEKESKKRKASDLQGDNKADDADLEDMDAK